MTNAKYFFCYSLNVHKYIEDQHNINYVCTGLHERTHKKFWLYEQSEQLGNALKQYKQIKGSDID